MQYDMTELRVAADYLEERGMCPTAVAALRQELRFAQAVAEVLQGVEWSAEDVDYQASTSTHICPRCNHSFPDHDPDCGLKYLLDLAKMAATEGWRGVYTKAAAMMRDIYGDDPEAENYDIEIAHSQADKLLCKLLRDCGYYETVDIYEKGTRWYA